MATFTPMPPIVYGTAWKKARTADLVVQALTAGFRGIDTACQPRHYHEPGVGEALRRAADKGIPRSEIYVQTKFTPEGGQDPDSIPYDPRGPFAEQVATSFAASQRNLGTDYLDGWVMHSPMDTHEDTLTVWAAMEAEVDAGRVGQLGISNCYELEEFKAIWAAARVKPTVLQNRFYADSGHDVALRAFCRDHGVTYQSFWTLTGNPKLLASSPVRASARRLACTPAQVFFRFVMDLGITPLTGTKDPQHMAQDLAVVGLALTEDERAEIGALIGG